MSCMLIYTYKLGFHHQLLFATEQVSIKMILSYLVLFLVVNEAFSAVHLIKNTEDIDHPGLCHLKDSKTGESLLLLKLGELKKHPKECSDVMCGKDFTISISGCGVAVASDDCIFVKGRENDPYPECCGGFECKGKGK